MKEQLEVIRQQALDAISGTQATAELEAVRVQYLGKKGELTAVLKQMGKLSPEERPVMGLNGLLQLGADLVGHLAHDGALFRRQLAHLLQHGGQFALFAQILDTDGFQVSSGLSAGDGFHCTLTDGFQLFLHG